VAELVEQRLPRALGWREDMMTVEQQEEAEAAWAAAMRAHHHHCKCFEPAAAPAVAAPLPPP
jgi:hypothetical protein